MVTQLVLNEGILRVQCRLGELQHLLFGGTIEFNRQEIHLGELCHKGVLPRRSIGNT